MSKLIKAILIGLGLLLAVWLGFSVIGLIYSGLWYLFLLGVVAIGAYGGYKYLESRERKSLPENRPADLSDLKAVDKTLEEYKQKLLK